MSDPSRRLDAAKTLTSGPSRGGSERDELAVCLRALGSLLRDLGILAMQGDRETLVNADLVGQLDPLTRSYDAERSVRAYAAVDEALVALERNASPKVVADWLVLQL